MKFLFSLQCGGLGGTERATLTLLRGLKERGHECEVVSLEPIAGLEISLDALELSWHELDFRRLHGLPALIGLARITRRFQPDVFVQVAQRPVTTLVAGLSRVPHKIYQCHSHHRERGEWLWRQNYRLVMRIFDAITFNSAWCADEAASIHPPLRSRGRVLYAPVPLHPIRSEADRQTAREKLGLPRRGPLIGALGRQVEAKRFDVFLAAAEILARREPDARFLLVGEGPHHEALKAQIDRSGLEGRIACYGWQRDVDEVYRSLDVVVFTSDLDAFGLVPCEALSWGVPAVCAVAEGGLFEVLPRREGYCLERLDPVELANAVAGALNDPRSKDVVEESRRALERYCDPDRYTESFLDLIGEEQGRE